MIEAAGKTIEPRVTCDIFCHVIDNFGDAGVCWRLARGLSEEEGFRVTLYIDDAVTLSKITSGVPAELPASGAESPSKPSAAGFLTVLKKRSRGKRCMGIRSRG